MRKDDDLYTIGFAVVVCLVCSLMLSVAAALLQDRQQTNAEIARQRHVLKVFGREVRDAEEIQRIFREYVELMDIAEAIGASEPVPLYRWVEDDRVEGYAFPVEGRGLWSLIRGYLALEADLATIKGITFYEHGETPGLGAAIEGEAFQEQFRGQLVFEQGEAQQLEVVKGRVADKYPAGSNQAVDGISGATLTGQGVQRLLNAGLDRYEPYFSSRREER